MFNLVKRKSSEIIIAVCLFFFLLTVTPVWLEIWREGTDSADFFVVRQLYVPDTSPGGNPDILYDRVIKANFFGEWNTEVQRIDGSTYYRFCDGSGKANYSPTKSLPPELDLEWLLGHRNCNLIPGTYRMEIIWTLHVPGYPTLYVTVTSNIFTVK